MLWYVFFFVSLRQIIHNCITCEEYIINHRKTDTTMLNTSSHRQKEFTINFIIHICSCVNNNRSFINCAIIVFAILTHTFGFYETHSFSVSKLWNGLFIKGRLLFLQAFPSFYSPIPKTKKKWDLFLLITS